MSDFRVVTFEFMVGHNRYNVLVVNYSYYTLFLRALKCI
jgi:hypothetical protein